MFNSHKIKFERFKDKVWLSTPTMHGDELKYVTEAYETNWMSTVGENIDKVEVELAKNVGCRYAIGLSSGTAALHLAVKLAGEKLYGMPKLGKGCLCGKKVFCSDLTFCATINPIIYEGGEPVFIDSERETWNMDPEALEKAFEIYPDVRLIVFANLYGTPSKMDELRAVAKRYNALMIEDAAESLGATYKGIQTGNFGDYNCISFNGNKIITGSSGGMFLTNNLDEAHKVRKWSTQARENSPWYQHEEIGYNYRMSNVIAGIVRGQVPYLEEHIMQKKIIYERYKEELKNLPITMNPYDEQNSQPNFWLSCILIDEEAMCKQVRGEHHTLYNPEKGKSCPTEILERLSQYNVEGRPIWKPLSMQPIFRGCDFISIKGSMRGCSDIHRNSVGYDLFTRGLCLPSDNKMSVEEQEKIISLLKCCFE